MGRKPIDSEPSRYAFAILLLIGFASCTLVYALLSMVLRPGGDSPVSELEASALVGGDGKSGAEVGSGECCRGIENLELWGPAVKWGSEFKFNSSKECCMACKQMCSGNDGPCLCDTWVFCGNREACGSKFGECWLKKQKDALAPDRQEAGHKVSWTSGIIFGKGEGIVELETDYGTLHIKGGIRVKLEKPHNWRHIHKSSTLSNLTGLLHPACGDPDDMSFCSRMLLPDCAPHSVAYVLELLALRHCAGCQFYRAEGRGMLWDSQGNHIKNAPLGPPFALIQGALEAQGTTFNKIPTEACPRIQRGSVAWVGGGPEFFISLANHEEWQKVYTVFGSVLPEDMEIAEKIAQLPTRLDVWNNINVSVLENPVPIRIHRMKKSERDLGFLEKVESE